MLSNFILLLKLFNWFERAITSSFTDMRLQNPRIKVLSKNIKTKRLAPSQETKRFSLTIAGPAQFSVNDIKLIVETLFPKGTRLVFAFIISSEKWSWIPYLSRYVWKDLELYKTHISIKWLVHENLTTLGSCLKIDPCQIFVKIPVLIEFRTFTKLVNCFQEIIINR